MKNPCKILVVAAIAVAASASAYEMPGNIYLIGDATPAGWTTSNAVEMTKGEGNTFTWEGNLKAEGQKQFKILGQKDWGPVALYAPAANTPVTTGTQQEFNVVYGGDDNKWCVQENGHYRLTLVLNPDGPDSNAGTITVDYLGGMLSGIFMLGSASGEWDSNRGMSMWGSDGVYSWTGDLAYTSEDKLFKFTLTRGNWNEVTFLVPEEVNHNDNVLSIAPGRYSYKESREDNGGLRDWFWGLEEDHAGNYTVSVDTNNKTLTLALNKADMLDFDNVTELHMLGLAVGSFDSNNPVTMTPEGNGVFTHTLDLDYDATDDDPNHANKQFKFVTSKGDWNQVFYLVPEGADKDGYIHQIETSNYTFKSSTWRSGRTGVDAFYGVAPGTKGTYKVTVNVPEKTLNLAEAKADTETGVEDIMAAANAAVEIWDLEGRRMDNRCTLAPGIYVVRCGGETKKVVVR